MVTNHLTEDEVGGFTYPGMHVSMKGKGEARKSNFKSHVPVPHPIPSAPPILAPSALRVSFVDRLVAPGDPFDSLHTHATSCHSTSRGPKDDYIHRHFIHFYSR